VEKCPPGQNRINNVCFTCIPNSTFNPLFRTCICNQGFSMDGNSQCQPDPITCPIGQRYRAQNNSCQNCRDGCTRCLRDFTCVGCPEFYRPIGDTCNPICGDRITIGVEQCDDGNTAGGDGCSVNCQIEPGFECTRSIPSVCTRLVCGDGRTSPSIGEQCDDMNTANGDGCSSTCQIEPGFICANTPAPNPSLSMGNGAINNAA
jgi:cysteine-rich repeat protein